MPFVFSVGISGHRSEALPQEFLAPLRERLHDVLLQLSRQAHAIYQGARQFFSDAPPRLLIVSPLADGADQIAAEIALELGFELYSVLPFARGTVGPEASEQAADSPLERLIARSSCVLELPGEQDRRLEGFVMAGRATLAHCDVLIAVWDGLPARGRGGTGEIVDLALARGIPTVHVPIEPAQPTAIHWSAFDPAVVSRAGDATTIHPFGQAEMESVLRALLAPPPDEQERAFLRQFQTECRRRLRLRLEYPLLLAATGVSTLRTVQWRDDPARSATRAEWRSYRDACSRTGTVEVPLNQLQRWYEWADVLAGHFAQSYRSGHVFNFVLGAVAVLLALSGLVAPGAKKLLVSAEFAVILAVLVNTHIGVSRQWHRRWLDYRQLAERLRPMRALKLLGIAAPDPPGSTANPVATRWVDWYAAVAWRAASCPAGGIDPHKVSDIAATIAEHEIVPQIGYHRSTARQVEHLDRRLEAIGYALFGGTLFACASILIALLIDPHWVQERLGWFTLITAGLPAVGTASFGIRVQGDYSGSAVRSEQTARALERIAEQLEREPITLARTADLVEEAARTMLVDLDEWRLLNQQHELSV